jgi:ubiquinone/menaquinone biosynthesis C-methylase UbiE
MRLYRWLIGWAFARFYREFSWTYDAVAWLVSRGLWRAWALAALPYLHGRVLELGCGTGFVQYALAHQRPGCAVGLDASPFMLRHTTRRLRRAGLQGRLVHAVGQAIPFRGQSFDRVLATFPSEYILHPDTLSEVRRVLAPGGQLIIVDAAQFTSEGVYERAVDAAYRVTLQASVQSPPAHVRYVKMIEQAGFTLHAYQEPVRQSIVTVLVGDVAGR